MSEQKMISVLTPVNIPVEVEWIKKTLLPFLNRPVELVLLHVVDTRLMESLNNGGIGNAQDIFKDLKTHAEARLAEAKRELALERMETLIVEGVPSLEIIKISKDLHVDSIAMKIHSSMGTLENLFFGSTAEHVIRGSSIPVICLP